MHRAAGSRLSQTIVLLIARIALLAASPVLSAQSQLSYEDLVRIARENGIDSSGSRVVLEARLGELLELADDRSQVLPPESQVLAEVERADSASYLRRDSGDELELQGGVIIAVDDEQFSLRHYISADLLLYNQSLGQLSAEGNVRYEMSGESGQRDRFYGEKLLFLLDENETLFVDGEGEADNAIDSEASSIYSRLGGEDELDYRFAARFITRNQNNVIIMDDGMISSSRGGDNPYYRIDFDKLWLLSPGEWGIDGARMFVGNIPLLALPFMYLPGNEVVFHPVFVMSGPRGYGLNTTTYLVGRRESSESPFSFLQMTDDVQTSGFSRMGIFLQPDDSPVPDGWAERTFDSVKLIADIYSARGLSVGLWASGEPADNSSVDILAAIALTRELYPGVDGVNYTSSYVSGDGSAGSVWHRSYLFDADIPFRFILDTELGWRAGGLSLDLDLPVYSDPSIYSEFIERSESMPWDQLLLGGTTGVQVPSFSTRAMSWTLRLGYTVPLGEAVRPYISTLRLTNVVSSFDWQVSANPDLDLENSAAISSPEDSIYAASKFQFPSGVASISGTLIDTSLGEGRPTDDEPLEYPEELLPPQDTDDDDAPSGSETASGSTGSPTDTAEDARYGTFLLPPEQPGESFRRRTYRPFEYRLNYSVSNTHNVAAQFHSPEESDELMSEYYSLQDSVSANLTQSLGLFSGALAFSTQASYSANFRRNLGYSDLLSQSEIDSLEQSAFAQESQNLRINQKTTIALLRPWYTDATLNLIHSVNLTPWSARRSADGSLDVSQFGWNTAAVSGHTLALNFDSSAEGPGLRHRAGLVTVLPPADLATDATYSLSNDSVSLAFAGGVALGEEDVEVKDLSAKLGLTPVEDVRLSAEGLYSFSSASLTKTSLGLNLPYYTGSLIWAQRDTLELNGTSTAWESAGDESFRLSTMNNVLDVPFAVGNLGTGEFSGRINAGWNHDFVEFTTSQLTLSTSIRLFVPGLLLVELSAQSGNSQMYRYFPAYNDQLGTAERNFFVDLLKSVNVFDRTDREESFFKLQRYSVDLLHDLGDWMLRLNYQWQPKIVTGDGGQAEYQLENRFTFYLQWLPISEIKNEIEIIRIFGEDEVTVDY
jgi:hypothetical protein